MKINKTILKIASIFIKKDRFLITFFTWGNSGSNINPLVESLLINNPQDYKINVISESIAKPDNSGLSWKIYKFKLLLKKYYFSMKSHLIVHTHGSERILNKTKMLNLWHGIPIKSMALMHKGQMDKVGFIKDDYFLSTSSFFNTVMNACIGLNVDTYHIAGYPRNDYLFDELGKSNLEIILNKTIDSKILFYMPTFKDYSESLIHGKGNLFGIENFVEKEFTNFLNDNNLFLVLKLHPNEERKTLSLLDELDSNRIVLIKNSDLDSADMDLYKLLNAADLLITDYSSVYFDFLLLNRPMVFTPTDIDIYRSKRGLLLEPYEEWTPGPKVSSQSELQNEILMSLNHKEYYELERLKMKKIFHQYDDNQSTKRVLDLIDEMMRT